MSLSHSGRHRGEAWGRGYHAGAFSKDRRRVSPFPCGPVPKAHPVLLQSLCGGSLACQAPLGH